MTNFELQAMLLQVEAMNLLSNDTVDAVCSDGLSGLAAKLNRLRVMGAAEIAYRVRQAAQARLERLGVGLARPGEPQGACGRAWLAEIPRDFDVAAYRTAADRVLAGRLDVLAPKNTFSIPDPGIIVPIMGTNSGNAADALFTQSQQKVLGLLFGQPDRQFHFNEILRLTGAGRGALQRELARLAAAGLVSMTLVGNQKRYQANRKAPIFEELRGIVLKTFGLAGVLREVLDPLAEGIRAAFVFGSVAKGTDRADSDVDVLVISDALTYGEVLAALEPAEARLGRKVNPAIYTSEEWRKRRAEGNAFVDRVLAGPRIWLIGDESDLG